MCVPGSHTMCSRSSAPRPCALAHHRKCGGLDTPKPCRRRRVATCSCLTTSTSSQGGEAKRVLPLRRGWPGDGRIYPHRTTTADSLASARCRSKSTATPETKSRLSWARCSRASARAAVPIEDCRTCCKLCRFINI